MEFIDSIGERLREERERLSLNQSQMAELAKSLGAKGATRQSQALYEKGEQSPSAAYIAAISTSGADVLYILTGVRSGVAQTLPAEEERSGYSVETLSMREQKMLELYRMSSEDVKEASQTILSAAAKSGMKKGKAA